MKTVIVLIYQYLQQDDKRSGTQKVFKDWETTLHYLETEWGTLFDRKSCHWSNGSLVSMLIIGNAPMLLIEIKEFVIRDETMFDLDLLERDEEGHIKNPIF